LWFETSTGNVSTRTYLKNKLTEKELGGMTQEVEGWFSKGRLPILIQYCKIIFYFLFIYFFAVLGFELSTTPKKRKKKRSLNLIPPSAERRG
jgi:hypothetical protein